MDGKGRSDWKFVVFVTLFEFCKVMVLVLYFSRIMVDLYIFFYINIRFIYFILRSLVRNIC